MSSSSPDFSLPILIYLSRTGCPACMAFEPHWEKIKHELNGRVRFVKFVCDSSRKTCPGLQKYADWFPSIILAGPKSYFRVFTADDKINNVDYSGSYEIKGLKFNAIKTSTGYEYAGRANTSSTVIPWFNRVVDKIPQIDESTLPVLYGGSKFNPSSDPSTQNKK